MYIYINKWYYRFLLAQVIIHHSYSDLVLDLKLGNIIEK